MTVAGRKSDYSLYQKIMASSAKKMSTTKRRGGVHHPFGLPMKIDALLWFN
jgi:hypothetical protein